MSYPNTLDSFTNPSPTTKVDVLSHAAQHAGINNAMAAVQAELGTNPKGAFASVAARLADIDNPESPRPVPGYTVLSLPDASEHPQSLVFVSDEVGGETIAFSDGTNWRRLQDLAIVSGSLPP